MFPHPSMVSEVRTLQNRDLLAAAARERLAKEAMRNALAPPWIDGGRASASRLLARLSVIAAASRSTRRLERAWS